MPRDRRGRRRATTSASSRTAARRTSRRATGGPVGSFGAAAALQLLSDQEPRRARRRRRADDRRRAHRRARPAAAQRRPDRSLSPRRVRRELAARRDAGGHPARPPAAARPGGRRARRALAARYRARLAGVGTSRSRPSSTPATSITCSRCAARRATRLQAHLTARGHRDADSLPGPDPAAAGARRRAPGRLPGRRPRLRARSSRCRSTRPRSRRDAGRRRVAAAGSPPQHDAPRRQPRAPPSPAASRHAVFSLILAAQFGVFEARAAHLGHSEAAPAFQGLFDERPRDRLPAEARARACASRRRSSTPRSRSTRGGVRDDERSARRRPNERRIVLLGDSLVLVGAGAVQPDVRRTARTAAQRARRAQFATA